jgi:hypothetical protein
MMRRAEKSISKIVLARFLPVGLVGPFVAARALFALNPKCPIRARTRFGQPGVTGSSGTPRPRYSGSELSGSAPSQVADLVGFHKI